MMKVLTFAFAMSAAISTVAYAEQAAHETYKFNTATVEPIQSGFLVDLQQNGVSLDVVPAGVVRTPELGLEQTFTSTGGLRIDRMYTEAALHKLRFAQLTQAKTLGRGDAAISFEADKLYEVFRIDNKLAICSFGKPSEKTPYRPLTSCIVDTDDNNDFDSFTQRPRGRDEFRNLQQISPVGYQLSEQKTLMYQTSPDKPLPALIVFPFGWNEKAIRLQGQWLVPQEEPPTKAPDPKDMFKKYNAKELDIIQSLEVFTLDFLLDPAETRVGYGSFAATLSEVTDKTFIYRVDEGFEDWNDPADN